MDAADVERLWQFVRSRADPIDPAQTAWDEMDNADVSVVTALERGAVASVDRCPSLCVGLKGVMSDGVKLPWLSVFFLADGVGFFWWVSDTEGWDRDTVAALAHLIDDLRRLAPDAKVDLEWDSEGEFFPAIDRFLSARAPSLDRR